MSMKKYFYRDLRIGILGGGQLGRMLIQAAIDLNLHLSIMDPSSEAPCKGLAHDFVQGDLQDYEAVLAFGRARDLISIEIEHVNVEALTQLQAEGKLVYPQPHIISMIQDKRRQKEFFRQNQLPTADFILIEGKKDLMAQQHCLPAVYKTAHAGYDGRGVQILRNREHLQHAPDQPGLLEGLVPIAKEIAVIAARNPAGEIRIYPPVEMHFDPEQNLVDYLLAPAKLEAEQADSAQALALRIVKQLGYVGVMAVEMFLTLEGDILINELAPRPHNSGHQTIRANITSQYEQHLRAILGLPLGDPRHLAHAAMLNLLGDPDSEGAAVFEGLEAILARPGVYPHVYGKAETRPHRKMGHVTLLDVEGDLIEKLAWVREALQVRGES